MREHAFSASHGNRDYCQVCGEHRHTHGSAVTHYQHDCDQCIFLGSFKPPMESPTHQPVIHDLYYCPRSEFGGSVIGRYGNEGCEYCSMALELLQGLNCGAVLKEAARRAIKVLYSGFCLSA